MTHNSAGDFSRAPVVTFLIKSPLRFDPPCLFIDLQSHPPQANILLHTEVYLQLRITNWTVSKKREKVVTRPPTPVPWRSDTN